VGWELGRCLSVELETKHHSPATHFARDAEAEAAISAEGKRLGESIRDDSRGAIPQVKRHEARLARDREPPVVPGVTGGLGFAGLYDDLGRTLYANLQFEF
jgi:hypothetical protein